MNKLGAVGQSFTGKKLTGYDVKRMEKIAVNLAAGDIKSAKQGAIEYMEDQESDKFRHIVTMLIATGAAVAAGRKLGKPIVKNLSVAGDVVCDWFRKAAGNDGKKIVTDALENEVNAGNVKKLLGKVVKNSDHLENLTKTVMDKMGKKDIAKVKDIAEIGVGGIASYILGGGINKVTDIVDDKTDAKRQREVDSIDENYDLKTEWQDYIGE